MDLRFISKKSNKQCTAHVHQPKLCTMHACCSQYIPQSRWEYQMPGIGPGSTGRRTREFRTTQRQSLPHSASQSVYPLHPPPVLQGAPCPQSRPVPVQRVRRHSIGCATWRRVRRRTATPAHVSLTHVGTHCWYDSNNMTHHTISAARTSGRPPAGQASALKAHCSTSCWVLLAQAVRSQRSQSACPSYAYAASIVANFRSETVHVATALKTGSMTVSTVIHPDWRQVIS